MAAAGQDCDGDNGGDGYSGGEHTDTTEALMAPMVDTVVTLKEGRGQAWMWGH